MQNRKTSTPRRKSKSGGALDDRMDNSAASLPSPTPGQGGRPSSNNRSSSTGSAAKKRRSASMTLSRTSTKERDVTGKSTTPQRGANRATLGGTKKTHKAHKAQPRTSAHSSSTSSLQSHTSTASMSNGTPKKAGWSPSKRPSRSFTPDSISGTSSTSSSKGKRHTTALHIPSPTAATKPRFTVSLRRNSRPSVMTGSSPRPSIGGVQRALGLVDVDKSRVQRASFFDALVDDDTVEASAVDENTYQKFVTRLIGQGIVVNVCYLNGRMLDLADHFFLHMDVALKYLYISKSRALSQSLVYHIPVLRITSVACMGSAGYIRVGNDRSGRALVIRFSSPKSCAEAHHMLSKLARVNGFELENTDKEESPNANASTPSPDGDDKESTTAANGQAEPIGNGSISPRTGSAHAFKEPWQQALLSKHPLEQRAWARTVHWIQWQNNAHRWFAENTSRRSQKIQDAILQNKRRTTRDTHQVPETPNSMPSTPKGTPF